MCKSLYLHEVNNMYNLTSLLSACIFSYFEKRNFMIKVIHKATYKGKAVMETYALSDTRNKIQ